MHKWTAALLALILLMGLGLCALGEAAPEATPTAASPIEGMIDGLLRVRLSSLRNHRSLGLTLDGAYAIEGTRPMQFVRGTEIAVAYADGNVMLQTGGLLVNMGSQFTLSRRTDEEGLLGGAYIHESEKDTLYCGDITISAVEGHLQLIIAMNIEDYLYGVVPYEMSNSFPLEALKAQAIAARTYAMQRKARYVERAYDVVDTANDQVFKGFDARYENVIRAVDETRGIVGMYKEAFAECFYSASNGGQTALATDVWNDGDFDYMDMRDDPYDLENPESSVKTARLPKDGENMPEKLKAMLVNEMGLYLFALGEIKEGEAIGIAQLINVEAIDPVYEGDSRQYGTIRFTLKAQVRRLVSEEGDLFEKLGDIELVDSTLTIDLPFYEKVRSAAGISINSSKYDMVSVTEEEDAYVLTNRRYGHGVGMSQRGAEWMAKSHDKTFVEILAFYYPGMDLVQMHWTPQSFPAAQQPPEALERVIPRPTPTPTPAPLPPLQDGEYYARVIVSGPTGTLNVRMEPSTEADIQGKINNNARLIVMEELPDGWAKMKTAELEGYVSMTYIEKE